MTNEPTPTDAAAMPPASAGSQPVAWEVMLPGVGTYDILSFQWEADAIADGLREREGAKAIALPLYRQPQPTLTDEEREAIRWFSDYGDLQSEARRAEVLRGLLERTH